MAALAGDEIGARIIAAHQQNVVAGSSLHQYGQVAAGRDRYRDFGNRYAEDVAAAAFPGQAVYAGQFLVENEIWGWGELGSDDSSLGDEARYQLDDEVQEEPSVDFEMTDEWIMALISLEASEEEGLQ